MKYLHLENNKLNGESWVLHVGVRRWRNARMCCVVRSARLARLVADRSRNYVGMIPCGACLEHIVTGHRGAFIS